MKNESAVFISEAFRSVVLCSVQEFRLIAHLKDLFLSVCVKVSYCTVAALVSFIFPPTYILRHFSLPILIEEAFKKRIERAGGGREGGGGDKKMGNEKHKKSPNIYLTNQKKKSKKKRESCDKLHCTVLHYIYMCPNNKHTTRCIYPAPSSHVNRLSSSNLQARISSVTDTYIQYILPIAFIPVTSSITKHAIQEIPPLQSIARKPRRRLYVSVRNVSAARGVSAVENCMSQP